MKHQKTQITAANFWMRNFTNGNPSIGGYDTLWLVVTLAVEDKTLNHSLKTVETDVTESLGWETLVVKPAEVFVTLQLVYGSPYGGSCGCSSCPAASRPTVTRAPVRPRTRLPSESSHLSSGAAPRSRNRVLCIRPKGLSQDNNPIWTPRRTEHWSALVQQRRIFKI